jgi:hypothetical protein
MGSREESEYLMANYYGKGRSNYVRVNDVPAFEAAAEQLNCEVITIMTEDKIDTLYGVMDANEDGGGFDFHNHETDEDLDPVEVLAPFLVDGEVMIFQEVGSTKYRYLTGHAFAFNNEEQVVTLNLDEIYDRAKSLGTSITKASY